MRAIATIAVAFCVSTIWMGCAASVETVNQETYRQPEFNEQALREGGIAILPVVAGQGIEGFRRPFGRALNKTARGLLGAGNVMAWQETMDELNKHGATSAYNEIVSTYQQTSILNRSLVQKMGEACGRRYFLFVRLGSPIDDSQRAASDINEGSTYEQRVIGVEAVGQVWDAANGDIVWEGTGASWVMKTQEIEYIKDADINTYGRNAAQALVRGIFGLPATGAPVDPQSQQGQISESPQASQEARTEEYQGQQEIEQTEQGSDITPAQERTPPPAERPGDGGQDVAWVQQTLTELGYDCGVVDGLMGGNTRSCIRAFQQANGLEATGTVNEATYEKMLEVR